MTPPAIAPVLLWDEVAMALGELVLDGATAELSPELLLLAVVVAVLVPVLVATELVVDTAMLFVVVPSSANALVLKPLLVLTKPDQLVLPITVTVVG
jgi:hypothetical protein